MPRRPNVPGRRGADATPSDTQTSRFSGRTAWARNLQTPLREFLRTETGGAAVLLAAAAAALVWVNVDAGSYDSVWSARLSIDLGGSSVTLDLRNWVNSGLMTFFFFVVGLEARREFDLGELRERRRLALPLLAGTGGMAAAIAIYLAFNAGRPSAHGWGIVMSSDITFDARAGDGTVSRVPGATHRAARAHGKRGAESCDLCQRAPPAAVPPLDELRDRAAVRAGECRYRHRRQLSREGDRLVDHA